jgi:peptidoglycan/LPS O-acetylase OafA/YrhL
MSTPFAPLKSPLVYRPDLDGLRSLAILPVVFYHYGLSGVSGGFVGVDVFFVISGFLITSLLLRDIEAGDFSIIEFYERRARRILPALFFVLAVTTALAFLVFLPVDLGNYGKSLIATTAFGSNVFFWKEFGYFDRAAELKPLLHTWSLAVEEQFYIVFPLLLWLISRMGRRRVIPILVSCLCASLLLSVLAIIRWPAAGFYLPATRAWELLSGALLAAGAMPTVANTRVRNSLSIVGILLILGSVVFINIGMAFPGWAAAVPCLGAALIIHASLSGGAVGNRLLQWKPLVRIGLVSYSLYLWHWPLLVLAKYAANRELNLPELVAIILMTGGLSFVSWRYVERPFRGGRSAFDRRGVFQFAGVGSAVAVACGMAFIVTGGFPLRLPPEVLRYAQVTSEDLQMRPECFNRPAADVREGRLCRIGADTNASPSFIVWGDSHALFLSVPLAEIARTVDRIGLLASVGSCPPLVDVQWPLRGCGVFNDEVLKLVERQQIETVILAGMWANYAEGTRFKRELGEGVVNILSDDLSIHKTADENREVFARALRRTVDRLTSAGVHVVIIGPVPEIDSAVPETLAKAEWFGGRKDIGPSVAEFRYRQRNVFKALEVVGKLGNTDVIYPSMASCAANCAVERLGQVLYIDDNHLSRAGLDLLKPLLMDVFDLPAGKDIRKSRSVRQPRPRGNGTEG